VLVTVKLDNNNKNLFMVPFGRAGTEFVNRLSNLFNCYGTVSALECIAALVMPALLLQHPHSHSKSRDHLACLERRLPLWKDGNILTLLEEGSIIQKCLPSCGGSNSSSPENTAWVFARLMFQGKVKAALRCLSNQSRGSFLPVAASVGDSTVLEELTPVHYLLYLPVW